MDLAKIRQAAVLLFGVGFLQAILAETGDDWEDPFEWHEDNLVLSPKEPSREEFLVPEEAGLEVEEVRVILPRQRVKIPRKDFAMVPLSNRKDNIRDETAITGENAKARLPLAVKPQQESPPLIQDISQIIHPYLPTDFYSNGNEE